MGEQKHPAGLKALFFTEMWERFGFYLMVGIFFQYLSDKEKGGFGWSEGEASSLVGSYMALVYLTPFIGGILADRVFGYRRSIVAGAILMMSGYFLLMVAQKWVMYLGCLCIIIGNGAFKPNISTLLGRLYPPGSPLKDAGYNIFYMGINVGAFFCNFVAAFVRNYFDNHDYGIRGWNAAFGTAGVGMLIGLIIFLSNYRRFRDQDVSQASPGEPKDSMNPLWFQCLLPAAIVGALCWVLTDQALIEKVSKQWFGLAEALYESPLDAPIAAFFGACVPVVFFFIRIWRGMPTQDERGRVLALLVIYLAAIVFWMTYGLNTTALNIWARDDTNRVPNEIVKVVTDRSEEFAENLPPKYFVNADADTPRPNKNTFQVVSEDEYKRLEKAGEVSVVPGKKTYVTQEVFDKVYARATPETPILEEGKHVRAVNTELFQSINAGQIVLFTPLVVAFFAFLRRRGTEPTTPGKVGLGLLINAGSPLVMFLATMASDDGQSKVSAWWLFAAYGVATVGELCLSPMGLSLVSKVSPPKITAFMMGGFFLSISLGNKLSGIFGEVYANVAKYYLTHNQFWLILVACNVIFGGLVFALLPWLKRQMGTTLD